MYMQKKRSELSVFNLNINVIIFIESKGSMKRKWIWYQFSTKKIFRYGWLFIHNCQQFEFKSGYFLKWIVL